MKIYHSISELQELHSPVVFALGTFDGFHRGHQEIIRAAVQLAEKKQAVPVILTFTAHPLTVLDPSQSPLRLLQEGQKAAIVQDMHVPVLLSLPMTQALMAMPADTFLAALIGSVPVAGLVAGDNFTFGAGGTGTSESLKAFGAQHDIDVCILQLLTDDDTGHVISSTQIRSLIQEGHMEQAELALGRPFSFTGTVIQGDQRGRTLGFPTLNFLYPEELIVPPDGVYVARAYVKGHWYGGVANIGDNPTFANQYHRCEVHVLDFHQDVYGETVTVQLLKHVRKEIRFDSLQELISQMQKDKEEARAYLTKWRQTHT